METSPPLKIRTLQIFLGLAAALLLFVAFDLLRLTGPGGEHQISRYANLKAARQAGVIERGWVPALLPAGSTDLKEVHDLDKNTGTGTFRFPSAELDTFKAEARRFGGADVKEAGTVTYVAYAQDRSRFELIMSPDPQKADVMNGIWGMKPIR